MRRVLTFVLLGLAATLVAMEVSTPSPEALAAPGLSLERLKQGNARFVSRGAKAPRSGAERRAEIAKKQKPFAAVLACADSRVAPELLFDQGLGDLFVVRVAGNVLDEVTEGSIEYAVEHLGVPLVVVLGHERCGAVNAAVDAWRAESAHAHQEEMSPNIHAIIEKLEPAIQVARTFPGDLPENTMMANAKQMAFNLGQKNKGLRELVEKGTLKVTAARYDLDEGRVSWHPVIPEKAAAEE
jgi:carbonic anhydrase